ncbi:hypothetical protein BD310DRAFT_923596 [Dichomitus squalens]|uniref:Uncharacterized protein n=1 Tax=Dichomitus squalens TaxID=114155 RepID=A0A4Q9PZ71_9APHY|nr:hypothetical protein BD310DRAFT_923596 [Dichomitus squalens]
MSSGHHDVVMINGLPHELLIEILDFVYSSLTPHRRYIDRDNMGPRQPVLWMRINHVCMHWRKIVCTTPTLWRDIHVYCRPEWLKLCLSRITSKPCPGLINLYFHDLSFQLPQLFTYLEPQQVTSLGAITLYADLAWMDMFSPLFSLPIPNLIALSIYTSHSWWPWPSRLDKAAAFPLTAYALPRLEELTLSRIHPPTDVALFSHMRILDLSSSLWKTSFPKLLDIMAECTLLEQLKLHNVLAGVTEVPTPASGSPSRSLITLPHLHTLIITHAPSLDICAQILSHLLLPAATHIEVAVDVMALGHSELHNFPITFAALLPPSVSVHIPSLSRIGAVEYVAYGDSYSLVGKESIYDALGIVHLSLCGGTHRVVPDGLPVDLGWGVSTEIGLRDLIRVIPGTNVESLELIVNFDALSRQSLVAALGAFPKLETLSLIGMGGVDAIWDSLTPASEDAEVVCPQLSNISVRGGDDNSFYASTSFLDDVVRALEARAMRGYVLSFLQLYMCHSSAAQYATFEAAYGPRLRSLVEVVRYHPLNVDESYEV